MPRNRPQTAVSLARRLVTRARTRTWVYAQLCDKRAVKTTQVCARAYSNKYKLLIVRAGVLWVAGKLGGVFVL